MALWHIDIFTDIIYGFGVRYLHLRSQERVDKARDENGRHAIERNWLKEELRGRKDSSSENSEPRRGRIAIKILNLRGQESVQCPR